LNLLKIKVLYSGICLLIILAVGCKSSKIVFATVEDNVVELNPEYLIDNISKYHGKTVQTKGIFSNRFEECSLTPATPFFDSATQQFYAQPKYWPGIWVELNGRFMPFDSVNKYTFKTTCRLSVIQGKIDTSNTGHMGSYYLIACEAGIIQNSFYDHEQFLRFFNAS
jgi:hypothetical protein